LCYIAVDSAVVCCVGSIYTVHDEVKDKAFILDLSWIAECQLCLYFFGCYIYTTTWLITSGCCLCCL